MTTKVTEAIAQVLSLEPALPPMSTPVWLQEPSLLA